MSLSKIHVLGCLVGVKGESHTKLKGGKVPILVCIRNGC